MSQHPQGSPVPSAGGTRAPRSGVTAGLVTVTHGDTAQHLAAASNRHVADVTQCSETPEHSSKPSEQQGRSCCCQSKGSQRGWSTAGALAELCLENCTFEPGQKSFSTEGGASICQGSWEVWLAQAMGVLSTAQQLRGVTERGRHHCTLLCSSPAEL